METVVEECEKKYGIPEGHTLIMAAIESARGVMKALDICEASERLFGIALSGGDYTKDLQTHITEMCIRDRLQALPFRSWHVWDRSVLFLSVAER